MKKVKEIKEFKKKKPLRTVEGTYDLPKGRKGRKVDIHRMGISVGIDPLNEKSPINFISKKDRTFHFFMTPHGPKAKIAYEKGYLTISSTGLKLFKRESRADKADANQKWTIEKSISWDDSENFATTINSLVYSDTVFQTSIRFIPGAITTVMAICEYKRLSWFFDLFEDVRDCTEEFIPAVIDIVDETVQCMANALNRYLRCDGNCGWLQARCRYRCFRDWLGDEAWCIANGIVRTVVEAARTVEECITQIGTVLPDEEVQSGDIVIFAADSPEGTVIDIATCGYGYSHAGLICGNNIIEATAEGVIERAFTEAQDREHRVIRLGLSESQINELCQCVRNQVDEDFDYIEAITFGTVDDPGSEICTMLIMHCLDEIGVDRSEFGLDGFVSPNDIARTFGVRPT